MTAPRLIAGGAVLVVLVLVLVLTLGGSSYTVSAKFVSASQLVNGNQVKVSGVPVGKVTDIALTDDGQAKITMQITADGYSPLRAGTRAIIRQSSLSGVANRYVDLQLGPAQGANIASGGVIPTAQTQSTVDLDQLFNIFDPKTRANTAKTVDFLRDFQAGNEDEANTALRYLNPALSSSSRLFAELDRNSGEFERLIVATSHLVTDVSARDDALTGLVKNLAATTDALAATRGRLGQAVALLPRFLRSGNTTFANLRQSLDDLDPLVNDAKPIVKNKLIPLLDQLRPFAAGAQPTIRDLSKTVRRAGADNDLIELLRRQPAIDKIANQSAQRNGASRPGAFAVSQQAFKGATPQLAFARPYAPDLVGWFDDFSTSGAYDALGDFSRAGLELNGFTLGPLAQLLPVPPALRNDLLAAAVKIGRTNRCPGAAEHPAPDGSNPYKPTPSFNCDPSQTPPG